MYQGTAESRALIQLSSLRTSSLNCRETKKGAAWPRPLHEVRSLLVLHCPASAAAARGNRERRLCLEADQRLRRELDLLTVGSPLHACACTGSYDGADSRSLAAAGQSADDGSQRPATAYFGRRILAAAGRLARPLVGLELVIWPP